jgi:ferrochelatase
VDKLRLFFNHPGFIEANAANLRDALDEFPPTAAGWCGSSSPRTASRSPWPTPAGTKPSCWRPVDSLRRQPALLPGISVYQSRSGPPHVPWLEPDICAHLESLAGQGIRDVVLHPIGFLSDHMEVRYDLDTESREKAEELGLHVGPGEDGRNGAGIRRDAPRADPGANDGAARTTRAGRPRPEPRHLSARLLSWPGSRLVSGRMVSGKR